MATPAEDLARLRVQYGNRWRIDRIEVEAASGPGFMAFVATDRQDGRRKLREPTAALLESELQRRAAS